MLCGPGVRLVVCSVATPVLSSVAEPSTAVPCLKFTVPVGVVDPAPLLTVAVSVTVPPSGGFCVLALIPVVVGAVPPAGSITVTTAVACAVAPLGSTTVSITVVVPFGYGPAGVWVMVIESPSGSKEPLSTLASALPPSVAAGTVTSCTRTLGTWLLLKLKGQAGCCSV